MTIKPQEVATIIVEGRQFDDWETVFVQHRWNDPYPIFRFTAAERDPIPKLWQRLQFKPPDECAIYLGGYLAIAGVITIRQTAYDANNHGVMLQGVGLTWYAARGSIMDKNSNYDGMTFEQIARRVISPFGVGVKAIGALNAIPFQRAQNEPGETVWNFLERIARVRGIVLGSDHRGNFLLIDNHSFPISAELVEGDNILRCQATFSRQHFYTDYFVRGQTAASDPQYGTDASEQEARAPGRAKRYSPLLTPTEFPVWNLAELADRAKNEALWNEGTEILVSITVQGWFRQPGMLWRAGDMVQVYSPMAMLDMALAIQCVTFTQDNNSGTLTTLELVAPWLLKDRGDWNVGNAGAPQEPGNAITDTGPADSPKAGTVADPPSEKLST